MITDHAYGPSGGWDKYDSPCLWCKAPKEQHEKVIPAPTARERLMPIMFWGSAFDPKNGGAGGTEKLVELGVLLLTGRMPNPQPDKCVRRDVPRARRDLAAYLLASGKVIERYMGHANCRICNVELGSADLGGWGHLWPERAEHYVLEHDVWVPGLDRIIERSGN